MEQLLLSVHVVAAIVLIGPVAVTTSLFPRYAPLEVPQLEPRTVPAADPGSSSGSSSGSGPASGSSSSPPTLVARSREVAEVLRRVSRVYGRIAVVVPVVGLVLAAAQGRTSEIWILVAMVLTAVAGALLVLQIAPGQREALWAPDDGTQLKRLSMQAGIFNLLWAVVVVLMIVRPGSSYP